MTPVDLLTQWTRLSGSAGLPFVTYYDVATGERTELSGTTAWNWVAKTSSLLVDECDAEPGTRLQLGLPTHWQRAVWILAGWNVGAPLVDAHADIVVTGPDFDRGASPEATHRLASALLPFGVPFRVALAAGFTDLGVALPGQPDAFIPYVHPTDDDLATEFAGVRRSRTAVLAGLTPSTERLLLTPGPIERDIEAVLAAALGGGSIVLVSRGSPDDLERVAQQEHARIA